MPHEASECGGSLAIEVALKSVTDGFVQHDAGPARAEHDVHLAGWRRNQFEVQQALTHGIVDRLAPGASVNKPLIAFAPAIPMTAGFLAIAFSDHDGDIDANQRANIAVDLAIGPHDLNDLPGRGNACRHLTDALILGPCVSVDLLQQLDLCVEARCGKRIVICIEPPVGTRRCVRDRARISTFDGPHGIGGTRKRGFRDIGRVGITHCFALHSPQAEALRGVVGCLLEPAIVEQQHLGLPVFKIKLAVIGAIETAANDLGNFRFLEAGAIEEGGGGIHVAVPQFQGIPVVVLRQSGLSGRCRVNWFARNISAPAPGSQVSDSAKAPKDQGSLS